MTMTTTRNQAIIERLQIFGLIWFYFGLIWSSAMMVKETRPQTVMTVLPIGMRMPDRGRQATVIRSGELRLGWRFVSRYRLRRLGRAQQIPGVLPPQLFVLLFTHLVGHFVAILVGPPRSGWRRPAGRGQAQTGLSCHCSDFPLCRAFHSMRTQTLGESPHTSSIAS